MLQILKEDVKQNYFVWFRWGRVGFTVSRLFNYGYDPVAQH